MKRCYRPHANAVFAALAFFAASGTIARAADVVEPKIPAPLEAPAFTWTGLYIGGNVGWGGGGDDRVGFFTPTPTYAGRYGDVPPNGVFGGGQIGYNWQMDSHWVFGIEADIQFSGLEKSVSVTRLGRMVTTESDLRWFGTVRPRLGYAFGSENRLLLYGTGGFAFGQVAYSAASTVPASTVSRKDTYTGYTVGGGAEYAFTEHWTGKLEYQYVNLGLKEVSSAAIGTFATPNFHSIRVGVNYKF